MRKNYEEISPNTRTWLASLALQNLDYTFKNYRGEVMYIVVEEIHKNGTK